MTQTIIFIIAQRSYRVQLYPASGGNKDLVLAASLQHLKPSVTIFLGHEAATRKDGQVGTGAMLQGYRRWDAQDSPNSLPPSGLWSCGDTVSLLLSKFLPDSVA